MPNNTRNIICLSGNKAKIKALFRSWENKEEKAILDFEKIIPPPSNMFKGDLGAKEIKECAEKNIPTWQDWCPKNWGTKWNAYEQGWIGLGKTAFYFETAWQSPKPIIEKIIEQAFGDHALLNQKRSLILVKKAKLQKQSL